MDTDLQPIAGQVVLTREVPFSEGVWICVYYSRYVGICGLIASTAEVRMDCVPGARRRPATHAKRT